MTLAYVDMPAVIQVQVYFGLRISLGLRLMRLTVCRISRRFKNIASEDFLCFGSDIDGAFLNVIYMSSQFEFAVEPHNENIEQILWFCNSIKK